MPARKLWLKKPGQLWPSQLVALHSLFHRYAPRFLGAANGGAGSDGAAVASSSPRHGAAARSSRLAWASGIVGRELCSFTELRPAEAAQLIELMKKALGQEANSPKRPRRRRRPGREQARAYGRAGRRGYASSEIKMVDAPTLELLDRLLSQLGWTRERLDGFLHSKKSPVRSGAIRTLGEANRVIWVPKSMLRRQESSAADAAALKRAG
jgi:hypothetical protein